MKDRDVDHEMALELEFLQGNTLDQQLQIDADLALRKALQEKVDTLQDEQELNKKEYLAQIEELQQNLREEQKMHLETIVDSQRLFESIVDDQAVARDANLEAL